MANEEKKDETPKANAEVKPASQAPAKEEGKAAAQPAKPEKAANCPVCNKPMKKKWYYRNNKYFCCKGCFKNSTKKTEGAEDKKPA